MTQRIGTVDRIIIPEFMDERAVADLRDGFDVVYEPGLWEQAGTLEAALGDAAGLIVRNKTQVTAELVAAAPLLRAVGRLGVGLDNIALEACAARDIAVLPAVGANARSVAEYVVATALILLRRAYFANGDVMAGHWPRERLIGREASGRSLGILGFGSIGQVVARMAGALDFTVVAHDPVLPADDAAWQDVTRAGFDDVLSGCDVITLHMPLLDATRNLIDAAACERMKPGAIVINTARGGIVDEEALADALRAGRLGGAALDVFAHEPLDSAAGSRFAGVPNLILTPHIAGITEESNARVSMVTAENVRRALMEGQ